MYHLQGTIIIEAFFHFVITNDYSMLKYESMLI